MGRRRKSKEGICPHCNIKLNCENGEDSNGEAYWLECGNCGRSYDIDSGKDITEYDIFDKGDE